MTSPRITRWQWLPNGHAIFRAVLAMIHAAQASVRLEFYKFADDRTGRKIREALLQARYRGVKVSILVDGIGSYSLPKHFFARLTEAHGEFRVFNPLTWRRFGIRNHRKLLVCDDRTACLGGFNIAREYGGDGVASGWRDLGFQFEGEMVRELGVAFDEMFALADFRHKRLMRLWQAKRKRAVGGQEAQLLLGGPGWGTNPIRRSVYRDLARSRRVQIVAAYFLPTWRIRRALMRIARGGGEVKLILAGKSDVRLSQLAGRSLYRRLLKANVQISEYQPQILHAKLLILDEAVYVGSANLDPRSLSINYELMLRLEIPEVVAEARAIFAQIQKHARPIHLEQWHGARSVWTRLKERLAYFLLVQIDPRIAGRQFKALPD
ncbi:MAG TPA: phosphatidylserine/phosphatidylglycerophosphate/cardiolipin synthase family protein [Verrucomicrobiota bacterium]|nr:phosphatidylserine/phosphatidylglycerophosphate/cardiolipin synthase family protein [Verrucomicrobiota bacterium]HNT14210.1 phosphatidylserine/phosphatidylglycerophosphate/cardiolipin synthase family protein [Verrucomicrobiota bacterium]